MSLLQDSTGRAEPSPGFVSWILPIVALIAAAAAFAIPGPTGQTAGIASLLALTGLAAAAGHTWGRPVSGFASVILLFHVWPIVEMGGHQGWGEKAVLVALLAAIPGALVFSWQLPRLIKPWLARIAPMAPRGAAQSMALALVVVLFALPRAGQDNAPAPSASKPELVATLSDPAPTTPESTGADRQASAERTSQASDIDIEDTAATIDRHAKAIAGDLAERNEARARAAHATLELGRAILAMAHEEARRCFPEQKLVDAVSGAAWQLDLDAERQLACYRAFGKSDH